MTSERMPEPSSSRPGGVWRREGIRRLVDSADFARAYTLAVFAAMVGAHLIEAVSGVTTLRAIFAGLVVIGIAILAVRRAEIVFLRLVPTTLLLWLGWTFASVFWSSDAATSLGRWIATAAIALLAVVIGHIRDTLQTVRALGDVLRVALATSLILEIVSGILLDMPLRFLDIQGAIAQWGPVQGIFGTRNLMGFVAVVALITFAVEWRTQSVPRGLSLFSVGLAGVLGVLSASPLVYILAAVVGAATGVLAVIRKVQPERRGTVQAALGAIITVGAIVLFVQRQRILDVLGATDDLAMRNELWSLIGPYAARRPVQGWGWFGPWEASEQPFITINILLEERHTTALNAYIDVLLQVGWVGVLLAVALGGVALVRAWLDASQRRSAVYAWTPLMLVALAVTSLFESFALFGLGWLLLVLCAVRAGRSRGWRMRLTEPGTATS